MSKIEHFQTDNPTVALIIAAHNAADHGLNFATADPRNAGHTQRVKQAVEGYIERFERI